MKILPQHENNCLKKKYIVSEYKYKSVIQMSHFSFYEENKVYVYQVKSFESVAFIYFQQDVRGS